MHMNNGGANENCGKCKGTGYTQMFKWFGRHTKCTACEDANVTQKSEKGFQEMVDSFKKIMNEIILDLEKTHGPSSWQIGGDWNVRALGLSEDNLEVIRESAKHKLPNGWTVHFDDVTQHRYYWHAAKRVSQWERPLSDAAFNSTLYEYFMNRGNGMKLWSKIKKTGSTSLLAEYTKKLNGPSCPTCDRKGTMTERCTREQCPKKRMFGRHPCKGPCKRTKPCPTCHGKKLKTLSPAEVSAHKAQVASIQQRLLEGDGLRLFKHVLQQTVFEFPSGAQRWSSQYDWVEPCIIPTEFRVTYPMDPKTGRYAEGTHQVPSDLDRWVFCASREKTKMEPGSWIDTYYKDLNVIGSDHRPVQKHTKFVWDQLDLLTVSRLARASDSGA